MHALIISLKQQWKIIKHLNERTEFTESEKLGSEISKMSFNLKLETSSALTPYLSHPAVIQPGEGAKHSLKKKKESMKEIRYVHINT